MIRVDHVYKTYNLGKTKVTALSDVCASIRKGDFLCIRGPSGSGKTTLLNLMGLLDRPERGELYFDGENVRELSARDLARLRLQKIGFIFQSFNLVPVLNVYENIELPLTVQRPLCGRRERRGRVMELIEAVGLADHLRHRPDELSGGQRQRVAIARALVTRPEIVLADEPTANLDSATGRSIIELMRELNARTSTTFVFSTHDPQIMDSAQLVLTMQDGVLTNGRR